MLLSNLPAWAYGILGMCLAFSFLGLAAWAVGAVELLKSFTAGRRRPSRHPGPS